MELAKPLSEVIADCNGSWDRSSNSSVKSLPAVACIEREDTPPPPERKQKISKIITDKVESEKFAATLAC